MLNENERLIIDKYQYLQKNIKRRIQLGIHFESDAKPENTNFVILVNNYFVNLC